MNSTPRTKSALVNAALDLALHHGNSIRELSGGWTKVDEVVHMDRPLTDDLRSQIESAAPELRYYSTDPTPHNKATEGFVSRADKVALEFPRLVAVVGGPYKTTTGKIS